MSLRLGGVGFIGFRYPRNPICQTLGWAFLDGLFLFLPPLDPSFTSSTSRCFPYRRDVFEILFEHTMV